MLCCFVRMGFHWPPFYSIGHMHLHAISPASSMSAFNRFVAFNPSFSYVFVDVNEIILKIIIFLFVISKNIFILTGRLCAKTYWLQRKK